MKIIVIGAGGLLGKELQKLNSEMLCPSRAELDITDIESVFKYFRLNTPDLVINCAAVIDNRILEKQPDVAIYTNIVGSGHVAMACIKRNVRLVYLSTDYIYKGDKGNYKEDDEVLPFNFYAWTKLGGECSAQGVKNHLIIRTSFGPQQFNYPQAFTDKWASKDYVDVVAPMILEAAVSPLTGILNLGTERKTLFDYAHERNEDVKPVRLADTNFFTPYDTSLNLQKWMDYKSSNPVARPHTNCRVCGSTDMVKYFDLGLMPLPNALEFTSLRAKEQDRFPLQLMFCKNCSLSQLSVVIDPGKMFSNYTYRSSVNGGYVKHCRQMGKDLLSKYFSYKSIFHIDIAGNDGTLLNQFKEAYLDLGYHGGYHPLNVDPASNLAAIAEANGIPTIADFWGIDVASRLSMANKEADLITATNVFAHVDNVYDFILAVKKVLEKDGLLVIECPYLIDFIENMEFDTIYHEHLSYMSIIPMNQLCSALGMELIEVQKQSIHGGTIRVTIAHMGCHKVTESVGNYIADEILKGFNNVDAYVNWAADVNKLVASFGTGLLNLKKEGYSISGFAASAKGNTLLNSAMINTDLMDYIVDDTPEKIGKYSPGTGIPIVHASELVKKPCDYLVILSWNFCKEIMERARNVGFKGKFIIPIPEFTIIED